jgi:hypothetical protein
MFILVGEQKLLAELYVPQTPVLDRSNLILNTSSRTRLFLKQNHRCDLSRSCFRKIFLSLLFVSAQLTALGDAPKPLINILTLRKDPLFHFPPERLGSFALECIFDNMDLIGAERQSELFKILEGALFLYDDLRLAVAGRLFSCLSTVS